MTLLADALTPGAPVVRLMRAAVVGSSVTGAAAAAHLGAGGSLTAGTLLAVAAGATALALVLQLTSPGRLGTGQLLGALLLGQAGIHLLAGASTPHALPMLASHAVAVAVGLVVARHADGWLSRLADGIARRAHLHVAVPPLVRTAPFAVRPRTLTGVEPVAQVEERGPPARAFVLLPVT